MYKAQLPNKSRNKSHEKQGEKESEKQVCIKYSSWLRECNNNFICVFWNKYF